MENGNSWGLERRWVWRWLLLWTGVLLSGGVAAEEVDGRPNLILISMDTTRADALSCYGRLVDIQRNLPPTTPNLDAIAEQGIRFEHFFAHAPTTLNSHTSMMSGLDPHGHGVPRNGFTVPSEIPLLAERLAEEGYDTIAVVGAAALDNEAGLDRGFRIYDDQMSGFQQVQYQDTAKGVVARAKARLKQAHREKPLFLFVHFYDPHGPLEAPEPFKEKFVDDTYRGPPRSSGWSRKWIMNRIVQHKETPADLDYGASLYLGEVAYMDHYIGQLMETLTQKGVLDRALVVLTADHGQVLSERRGLAYTHGYDVSNGVMQIPLIVRGYGGVGVASRRVVKRHAEMAGLAPTIEEALGLPPTLGQRRSFWSFIRRGPVLDTEGWPSRPARAVLMEATRPHDKGAGKAWNNLSLRRGIRVAQWLANGFPKRNRPLAMRPAPMSPAERDLLGILREMMRVWDASSPTFQSAELTDEMRRALEALGYLGSND